MTVNFDQRGPFGPAMTLIHNAQKYNEKEILELATLLKENFMKLAHVKPKGKKEFCAFVLEKNQSQSPITPIVMISTKFFQNMQKSDPSPLYHDQVLSFIVPRMLKIAQEQIPHANCESSQLKEWTARFVESYMTEEQIKRQCELQGIPENVMEERKKIGMKIYEAATKTQLTENDLNILVKMCQFALEQLKNADHFASSLEFAGRTCLQGKEALCLLSNKAYTITQLTESETQLTEKDLDILINVCQFALAQLQNIDHFASTLEFAGNYLTLFSKYEENPCLLGNDVLGLLSTVFREKMFPKH